MGMRQILLSLLLAAGLTLGGVQAARADWTYTVKRGDSLFSIARKTGVPVNSIKARNGLNGNTLRLRQRITIPTVPATARRAPTRATGDVQLLARVIHAEAGAEPYLGKVAVGGVILNRVQNSKFPKSIAGVVYQPHAFESVSNGIINRPPSATSQKAARDAISGWDPSGGALYFFNPGKTNNPWIWARRIINRIGKHVFAI
jgi:N-acetylmuramoyl-L-alanine amidase